MYIYIFYVDKGLCRTRLAGKAPDPLFTPGRSDCPVVHPISLPSGLEGVWFGLRRHCLLALGRRPQKLCSSLGLRPRPELSISPQRWRPLGTLCLDSDSTPQAPLAPCSEHMALVARAVAGQALVSTSGNVNAALAGPPGECGSGPSWLGMGWHAPCGSFGD